MIAVSQGLRFCKAEPEEQLLRDCRFEPEAMLEG